MKASVYIISVILFLSFCNAATLTPCTADYFVSATWPYLSSDLPNNYYNGWKINVTSPSYLCYVEAISNAFWDTDDYRNQSVSNALLIATDGTVLTRSYTEVNQVYYFSCMDNNPGGSHYGLSPGEYYVMLNISTGETGYAESYNYGNDSQNCPGSNMNIMLTGVYFDTSYPEEGYVPYSTSIESIKSVTLEETSYFCGNNIQEGSEECDGTDLGPLNSCYDWDPSRPYGTVTCSLSCTIDHSGCSAPAATTDFVHSGPFNVSGFEASENPADVVAAANDAVGGGFIAAFLIALFIITVIGLKRFDIDEAVMPAALVYFVVAILLWNGGFLDFIFVLLFLAVAAVTLFFHQITRSQ